MSLGVLAEIATWRQRQFNNQLYKMKKFILAVSVAAFLTGCMSLKAEMVNSRGTYKDCSATGGGLGLGAVVGVAIAAAARSSCVSDQKGSGFLEAENAGTLPVKFASDKGDQLIVSETKISGIEIGDKIIAIDKATVTNLEEFQDAAFGSIDQSVEIQIARNGEELTKKVSRVRLENKKADTK